MQSFRLLAPQVTEVPSIVIQPLGLKPDGPLDELCWDGLGGRNVFISWKKNETHVGLVIFFGFVYVKNQGCAFLKSFLMLAGVVCWFVRRGVSLIFDSGIVSFHGLSYSGMSDKLQTHWCTLITNLLGRSLSMRFILRQDGHGHGAQWKGRARTSKVEEHYHQATPVKAKHHDSVLDNEEHVSNNSAKNEQEIPSYLYINTKKKPSK